MNQEIEEPNTYLSKSLFLKGLQCHKYLYLEKYHPELRDEIPEAQETRFGSGIDVGLYARQLFPGGVEIPYEGLSHFEQIAGTAGNIQNGTAILYEGTFVFDNVFVKADILKKAEKGWELYEVKASTGIEEVHLNDVALQYYVISGSGLPVSDAFLVHINSEYVRQGDIDVWKLFSVENVTDQVIKMQGSITEALRDMRNDFCGGMPDIDIGPQCFDPYECQFQGYCWKHIPQESIFSIRGRLSGKFDLYRQGIVDLKDVPLDALSNAQRMQVEGTLKQMNYVDKEAIREFLNSLWFPLCFLDFETTFMVPIPLFDGTRPYQQVPFQYSLHLIEREGGELLHYDYLGDPGKDPRRGFIESLLGRIPEGSCILCYNKGFEIARLNDCKVWFPEYAQQIDGIIENIGDLMAPFRKKDVYYWQMDGSYSIKNVLPALIPEMSYEGMEISNGGLAADAWLGMFCMQDESEIERTSNALREYCALDTLSMVKILEKLREIAGS